ncbi:hypothetical protein Aglo03_67280 [Actinokineospora globicatena]|uniref:Helix-turn-helix of DDE superfamily endonuclease n=1 Tax=Actinokineospora globicatena TaxID=103729 RepID=A0A9W6VC36_9PSEU|nr:hypothetical protein Aglo03_67280 [Actinokineospora globicatena]
MFTSLVVTLTYLRRNRVQAELAETFGVSQSTISRAITAMTPLLGSVLADHIPTVDDVDDQRRHIIDGTLLPCWSWASQPGLHSRRHRRTGVNVQVACTLDGRLEWVSEPFEGRRHDFHCLKQSGILHGRDTTSWLADKGYIGSDMLIPFRKPRKREQPRWQKDYNFRHNKIRVAVERAIAHLKTWRILHTDYRRPYNTFATTITAVIGLYFYARSE